MFKRILVPVDGSELTECAIGASIELACKLGASITGFVAEPLLPQRAGPRRQAWMDEEAEEDGVITAARAQQLLDRFASRARDAGVPFTGHHDKVPRVDQAIVDAAEASGCDLIVMVTHGRGAFGEFLFGSQTKAVLAGCKLPLLVLQQNAAAASLP
jgi:nucleotide-binding universal stress UspA family protein